MSKSFLRLVAGALLAASSASASAQSFTENFDDITLLTANGWFLQNNSAPLGVLSWFQGTATNATPTPGPFDAWNGAPNAYIAANFNSTTGGTGTISNWLVAPNRTLRNGDVFQFYTRRPTTPAGGTEFPDRLEVRLSTNGASTNVGTGAAAFGDFSTQEIMSADLRHIYLGHLSRECNTPELAEAVVSERMTKIGANHVTVELTSQNLPCPTLTLEHVPQYSQRTLL